MSDHVVVKKDILESVLQDWIQFGCLTTPTCEGVQAAIDSTSPEMVPMSDVQELIKALTTISKLPGSWAIADDALAAFNAKFKV